jgi:hypothetical protein
MYTSGVEFLLLLILSNVFAFMFSGWFIFSTKRPDYTGPNRESVITMHWALTIGFIVLWLIGSNVNP